jgi:hypothetical protein
MNLAIIVNAGGWTSSPSGTSCMRHWRPSRSHRCCRDGRTSGPLVTRWRGETYPQANYHGTKHLAALTRALRPVDGRSQLIHGDLAGNVLFDDNLPPLVIDFSPYWRPPAFASAIVIADALTFEGAGAELVQPLLSDPDFPQHLLRALIYRIVTDQIANPDMWRADPNDPYLPATSARVWWRAARMCWASSRELAGVK